MGQKADSMSSRWCALCFQNTSTLGHQKTIFIYHFSMQYSDKVVNMWRHSTGNSTHRRLTALHVFIIGFLWKSR